MKKLISLLIAALMIFSLASTAFADEGIPADAPAPGAEAPAGEAEEGMENPFVIDEDGYIVGTFTVPGSFIEIVVNEKGAITGTDSVDIKVAAQVGENMIVVYVDGMLYVSFLMNSEVAPVDPGEDPGDEPELDVVLAGDASVATVIGDYSGYYARVALTIEYDGTTGLIVSQQVINEDPDGSGNGVIIIPTMAMPGLEVTGVCVAIVAADSTEEILAPDADVVCFDFV